MKTTIYLPILCLAMIFGCKVKPPVVVDEPVVSEDSQIITVTVVEFYEEVTQPDGNVELVMKTVEGDAVLRNEGGQAFLDVSYFDSDVNEVVEIVCEQRVHEGQEVWVSKGKKNRLRSK